MMKLDPQGGREEDLGRTAKNCLSLLAINGENAPDGYGEDFVLNVSTQGDKVVVSSPTGLVTTGDDGPGVILG